MRRVKRVIRRILVPIVSIFCIGFLGVFFYNRYHYRMMNRCYNHFIYASMLMDVKLKHLHIYNCSKEKQDDVLKSIRYDINAPLFIYDVHMMQQQIAHVPFVKYVSVHKRYPHNIDIYIKERQPIAQCIFKNQYAFVDSDGVFYQYNDAIDETLPVVSGSGDISKMFPPLFNLIERYPMIKEKVQVYQLVQNRRWNLMLQDGTKVMLPQYNVEDALQTFMQMRYSTHHIIDLRVKNYIFLR